MFFYEYAFVSLVFLKKGIFLGIRHLVKNRVPGKMEVNIVKRDALIFLVLQDTKNPGTWGGMGWVLIIFVFQNYSWKPSPF